MIDTLKKGILLGLGIAELTRERAEKAAKNLVKKGTITQKQGRQFVKTITQIAEAQQKKAIEILDRDTKDSLKRLSKISKKAAKSLEKRLMKAQRKVRQQAAAALKIAIQELEK